MIIEIQKTPKTKYLFLFTGYNGGQEIDDRRKNTIFFHLGNKTQYRQFA